MCRSLLFEFFKISQLLQGITIFLFQEENEKEFLKRVYWRGIEGINTKEVRRMAWPYLLGLFEWNESPESRLEQFTSQYWQDVSFFFIVGTK